MSQNLLTHEFIEPLIEATSVKVDIHAGDGNLFIDRLSDGEQASASGKLEYFDDSGLPARTMLVSNGQATLTLRASQNRRSWFHFPWTTCNGATNWQVHLNPMVASEITAHSDGGNIKLDLAGLSVTRISSDTGGGNVDVVLPEKASNMNVSARTGAGNVTIDVGDSLTGSNIIDATSGAGNVIVRIPSSVAACIHPSTGLGKVIVDARFSKIRPDTYQSPEFDGATDKLGITVKSGAGNVNILATEEQQ